MSRESGWFWPEGASRAHWIGSDGRALCGKWAAWGLVTVDDEPETTPCKECQSAGLQDLRDKLKERR